ncbi:MAG: hypothetical protein NTX15_00270 [Candidatus Kapabacteria bacterium]|nr:hypothetical protein [Candidatus Kapabacteria bacterium]
MENRNRDDRDPERQPLTNESAMNRQPARGGRKPRPGQGYGRPYTGQASPQRRPNPQYGDDRQPPTSENPYTSPQRGARGDRPQRAAGPARDDRRGPPRDDRRGPPRDDRRGPPRDDRRGPPRDDRSGAPRDDRRGPPRDDRRGPPRDDRSGAPRDDRRGPPRDDRRGPPRDDRRAGPGQGSQGGFRGPGQGRPRSQGGGSRPYDDSHQPITSENPANRSPRGRSGGGGFGGRPRTGSGGRPQRGGGSGYGAHGGPARRNSNDEGRSKVYTSDRLVFKENLDEKKPTERKMRSRRTRPSDDSGAKD